MNIIDLSSIATSVALPLALAAVTAGIPIVVPVLLKRAKLANVTGLNAKLVEVLDAGAGEAYRQAVLHGHNLTVPAGQNAAVAIAANYVLARLPDTLKQLGVTPDGVSAMVAARLGKLLAVDPTISATGVSAAAGEASGPSATKVPVDVGRLPGGAGSIVSAADPIAPPAAANAPAVVAPPAATAAA
jgi:hypothetical protein